MKLRVYRQLLRINQGFGVVTRSLQCLEEEPGFHPSELRRFRALVREARAATNSYLTAAIEAVETDLAGRLYGERLVREQEDDEGRENGRE